MPAMDFVWTALLFALLLFSTALGWAVQRRIHERHLTVASIDSMRLLMGMLLTFSALVLGLLTSNAKQRFDGYNNDLSAYGADLVELDHRLRSYGPEADAIRAEVRSYTAAAIAQSWPEEPAPPGNYPRFDPGVPRVEEPELGRMLTDIDTHIGQLEPHDAYHQEMARRLQNRIATTIQQRWTLIMSTGSTVSWPFLAVLASWLSIIFLIFGLTSPQSRLVYIVVVLSALSIASPMYLILEYSDALSGLIKLSSDPLRVALAHMDGAE